MTSAFPRCRVLPFLLMAVLLLGACQLPGGGAPPNLYTLTPKSTFTPDLPELNRQLVVERPIASAGLSTSRIALQRSPVSLEYYANANWTDTAPAMVQTLLIESFENSGRIISVARESATLRPDLILRPELREFQAEYDGSGPPLVRVRINARLIRMPDRVIVGGHTAEQTVRAGGTDLESIVFAFDEALGSVIRRVVEWTLRAAHEPPRTAGSRSGS
ncbi:MAG TPA: ABC-type transport auxiliary lipoprotein family protein [Alphaproteobacteria bacterium]